MSAARHRHLRHLRVSALALTAALLGLHGGRAAADTLDAAAEAGAAPGPLALASAAPADAQAPASIHGCVESIARGAARPIVTDDFPRRGTSGWAASLTVTIRHGRGEHVLPNGLELQRSSDAEKELRTAGFALPEQDGGTAAARVTVLPEDPNRKEIVVTVLELPLVLLPEKPGRSTLVLPPLPVAVARANGELSTVCTRSHAILVDDPIANAETADPAPRPNPPPAPQREEWREAKLAAGAAAVGLGLGVVGALLYRSWKRRPRPVPPPPPPRPAWELALERLHDVRHAGLLDAGRPAEFCDRVSDALREYLGASLGFDGLEQTTDEIAGHLGRGSLAENERARVLGILRECDLVKFAKFAPERGACEAMLDSAERHVHVTMPKKRGEGPRARAVKDAPAGDDQAEPSSDATDTASETPPADMGEAPHSSAAAEATTRPAESSEAAHDDSPARREPDDDGGPS
ncbi:MAG TPA: hypothetical protein PLR99_03210 [Polyangiaceae bacterium]|nr:hypothetical protein [Polyangiaceae bacterium]